MEGARRDGSLRAGEQERLIGQPGGQGGEQTRRERPRKGAPATCCNPASVAGLPVVGYLWNRVFGFVVGSALQERVRRLRVQT